MTDKTDSPNPINVPLPKDLEYENALNYRQLKPIISSTETSDDEKSGENTPINFPTRLVIYVPFLVDSITNSYVCYEFLSPLDPGIPPPLSNNNSSNSTTASTLEVLNENAVWSFPNPDCATHVVISPAPLLEPNRVTLLRQNSSYLCWFQLGLLLRL